MAMSKANSFKLVLLGAWCSRVAKAPALPEAVHAADHGISALAGESAVGKSSLVLRFVGPARSVAMGRMGDAR